MCSHREVTTLRFGVHESYEVFIETGVAVAAFLSLILNLVLPEDTEDEVWMFPQTPPTQRMTKKDGNVSGGHLK